MKAPCCMAATAEGTRAVAGDQDHLGVGLVVLGPAQDLQPVDVVHHQVGDDDVERVLARSAGARRLPLVATVQS